MPTVTTFADIKTCANQKDAFSMIFTPSAGVDMTGATVTCQIRESAAPGSLLITPTVQTSIIADGKLQAIFSWTRAQSAALDSGGSTTVKKAIEVDLALASDAGSPSMRFVSTLVVAPGGNLTV
jgi:hypothetical protein